MDEPKVIEGFGRVYDDKNKFNFDYSVFIYKLPPKDEDLIPAQRTCLVGGRTRKVRIEFLD